MSKLTKVQRAMLKEAANKGTDGVMILDGHEARVATRLAEKGLVVLPAGHGYYFGRLLRVRATDLGRDVLAEGGEPK